MQRLVAATGIALALVIAYVLWMTRGPTQYVSVGQPIRHDDFLFTVQRVSRRPLAGRMLRYTVDVLVENRALRVDYSWRDAIAYVIDATGKRYAPVSSGAFTIAAGDAQTAHVDFNLPDDIQRPSLRFWDGVFMGDAFNGNAYAHAAVQI